MIALAQIADEFFFHLTKLGINFDGNLILPAYAVSTFICCRFLFIYNEKNIPQLLKLKF